MEILLNDERRKTILGHLLSAQVIAEGHKITHYCVLHVSQKTIQFVTCANLLAIQKQWQITNISMHETSDSVSSFITSSMKIASNVIEE